MLGKCARPSGSASFRYLEEGMLFRLEPDPTPRLSNPQTPEYYWQGHTCSTAMPLHIDADGRIVTTPFSVAIHGAHADVVPVSVLQNALLLRSVRSRLRESNGHGMTVRRKEAQYAL